MKAVLVSKTTREIVDRPVPEPEADEVLIKGELGVTWERGARGLAHVAMERCRVGPSQLAVLRRPLC